MLSAKLVNAINYQTNLDDTLTATKDELETARAKVRELEQEKQEHTALMQQGMLVRKSIVDMEHSKLVGDLVEERRKHAELEKSKQGMDAELESLTTALFEEANKASR